MTAPRAAAAASGAAMRASPGASPGLFSSKVAAPIAAASSAPESSSAAGTCVCSSAAFGGVSRESQTRTRAPDRAAQRAIARPDSPRPSTSTEVSSRRVISTQFQARQADKTQQHRDDPEAHDDLRFLPSRLLEVMVQRRHLEEAPAFAVAQPRVLEPADLRHHRQRLDDEDAAHDPEDDLLARDHRDRAERATERERADVAHEDLRRIGVEPE